MNRFRDKEGLEVRFTTYYDGEIGSDLTIVIRQDRILTASWFDFDTYRKLNEGESPEPQPQCR